VQAGSVRLQAAKAICAEQPEIEIGVLVLSQHLEDQYPLQRVSQGPQGVGYLLKERVGELTAFTDAVRRVANGGSALDPEVVQCMVDRPHASAQIGVSRRTGAVALPCVTVLRAQPCTAPLPLIARTCSASRSVALSSSPKR
jgi:DNA-binding NarL/FixJ family response regulator